MRKALSSYSLLLYFGGEARDKAFLGITLAQLIILYAFSTKLYHLP